MNALQWENTRESKNVKEAFDSERKEKSLCSKDFKSPRTKVLIDCWPWRSFCCRGFSKQSHFFFVSSFLFSPFLSLLLFFVFLFFGGFFCPSSISSARQPGMSVSLARLVPKYPMLISESESEIPLSVLQMGKCVRHSSQKTVQYNNNNSKK